MRSTTRIAVGCLVGSLTVGCVGTVGDAPSPKADAQPEQTLPDAPPELDGYQVSGTTMDYFANTALAQASYATDGMTPARQGTSAAAGKFTLGSVRPASSFYVSITAGDV